MRQGSTKRSRDGRPTRPVPLALLLVLGAATVWVLVLAGAIALKERFRESVRDRSSEAALWRDTLVGPPEVGDYRRVTPGMTRACVLELLGEPFGVSPAGTAPEEYATVGVSSRGTPKRAAPAGGVLVYTPVNKTAVCYVFFDGEDRVVATWVDTYD
jgi:hypothetical protein